MDYYSDPMQVLGPQVLCGARASWGASAFSKASRVSKKAANCLDDENLHKYLLKNGER